MTANKKHNIFPIFIILAIIAHGVYILKQSYMIGFSATPSLPYSVFLVDKKDTKFLKNNLIVFSYPGKDIYNYKHGNQFVKVVSCMPNELLQTNNNFEYFCNGQKISQAQFVDSKGEKLPHFVFNGPIPKDNYFVLGTHLKSWDSKYWGFVSKDRIIGTAKGVL